MRAYEFLTEEQLDEINRREFLKKAGMATMGAALGTAAVDQGAHAADQNSPFNGRPMPKFTAGTVDYPEFILSSSDIKGPAVIVFWCSWARDSVTFIADQLPKWKTLFKGKIGIYGISWRDDGVSDFGVLHKLKYIDSDLNLTSNSPFIKCGRDPDGRVGIDFGIYGAPEAFLIDGSGKVVAKNTGIDMGKKFLAATYELVK